MKENRFPLLCLSLLAALLSLPLVTAQKQAETAQEKSVKPGINKSFLDPSLKVENWLNRFEVESREVFSARQQVLEACKIEKGMHIADIGAGTGLYTELFARKTGGQGWVFAVDINARFLEHISKKKFANVTSVLCAEDSVNLPPDSVDLAFVCDTYHHFEYPKSSLASIFKALKKGGQLIVIDFERIPGKSREWLLNHVRAGKEVFRSEILKAGFKLEEEVKIEAFKENYFLRFVKP